MKATWIAPFVLALATTPALAGEQAGSTGQATNSTSTSSQQGGGATDTTHEGGDTGTSGTSGIDNTSDSQHGQEQSVPGSTSDSGSMTDDMKHKAGDRAKSEIEHRTGTGSSSQ